MTMARPKYFDEALRCGAVAHKKDDLKHLKSNHPYFNAEISYVEWRGIA